MSLTWEPQWERVKVSYAGMTIETCRDRVTGLLLCPICSDIDKICPEGKVISVVSEEMSVFFTPEDLIHHLRTHSGTWYSKRIKPITREGEGR